MTSANPAAWPTASAEFLRETWAVAEAELRKLARDPTEIFSRAVQPALWLVIFGEVMAATRAIPTSGVSYRAFLTPGILAQSVLFSSIFYGISVIWERDLGIVHTLLVSPARRSALVCGKALSAGFRALFQAVIVYVIALALRIDLAWSIAAVLGVILYVFVGAAVFSTFSLLIATVVRTRERFMGIGQVLTMPLFFASSAIYPVTAMPSWLQVLARLNPLTYLVDALRGLMTGAPAVYPLGYDLGLLLVALLVLLAVAARMYPRLVQ